jgi:transglutaminase-like putative cysteine protease
MMMHKWFSKMRKQASSISRGVIGCSAAVLLLSCAAPRAFAGHSAPDWLKAAAEEKLPDYPKDTKAVILLDETAITVHANGEIYTRHREAIRLLRPEAHDEYGGVLVDFDKDTTIKSMKAWTIEPDGREIEVGEKDAVEQGFLNDIEYTDVKVKALAFPDAYPGRVVGYEYVQRNRPYVFEDDWLFQDTSPVQTARLILEIPPQWEFTSNWFNHPDVKSQEPETNEYVWQVDNLPAIEIEPEMPAWKTVAGWVGLKYFPSDPKLRAKATGSWKEVGAWYDELDETQRDPTPAINAKVAELTAGMSDPVQKMRAITKYVQENIRYFAVEIGIGGWKPHSAGEVFASGFGDCKDKTNLLVTMLRVAGIEAYDVSVDHRRGFIREAYPSIYMDHSILAIKLPEGANDPGLYATIDDPKLGRLLFFDSTDEYVSFGYLPAQLQGSYALVITRDGGDLVTLPLLPPSTNRLLRTAQLTLTPAGNLSGEIQEIRWGGPASSERAAFVETQPSKRAEIFEHFLGAFLNSFQLTGASLGNLNNYDQTLTLDYKFVAPNYAKSAGNLMIVSPRVVGDKYTGNLDLFTIDGKPRQYPIQFDEASLQTDVFDIKLPAGYVPDGLPQPVQASCDYATYHSNTTVANGVLHYQRTLEIKDVIVPKEKLPEIRAFLQQIAADQTSAAVLKKVTP